MKYKTIIIGLIVSIAAVNTKALENPTEKFGLGVLLGEPTGVSFKYWFDKERAVDGGIGCAFSENDSLQLHGDYLIHNNEISNSEQWPVYYGIGALLLFKDGDKHHDNETVLGFRVPIGMTYLFEEDIPYEFFFEVAPVLEVAPRAGLDVNASVGLRFYF